MSYQVIARKYRPQTFAEVVGQKPIVTTLKNAIEQQRVHHAYLFSGPRGVGKTTVARLLAKALNCTKGPAATACNECASCKEITASRSMDVLEIDGASNRGIENIRELRETVRYTPARDRNKVFIIDEVHMLTDPAWNALLKTLEEPPPHVVFIFATTEYRELPVTILSRCQHFEFKKVATKELLAHLTAVAKGEGVTVEPSALELIARLSEGSLRDALSALDQVIAFAGNTVTDETARTILGVIDRELIVGFFDGVKERDCGRLVGIIDTLFEKGYQPVDFLEDLMAYGRDLLLARTVDAPEKYLAGSAEEIRAIAERASGFTEDEMLRILELLTREEQRVKNSAHPRFLLEALGIKLARLADLTPIEDLLARLEDDGGTTPLSPGPASGAKPGASSGGGSRFTPGPVPAPAPKPFSMAAPELSAPAPLTPAPLAPVPSEPAPRPIAPRPPMTSQGLVEALLRKVHDERAAIGAFLEQAVWVQVVDDALRIVYNEKQSFVRDKIQSRDVTDYLKRVARELAGRDLRVQVDTATPGTLEAAALGAAPSPSGLAAGAAPPSGAGTPADPFEAAEALAGPLGEAETIVEVDDMVRPIPPVRESPEPRRPSALTDLQPAGTQASGAGPVKPARPRGKREPLDEKTRAALVEQAMQEPQVRSLIELLGGEIVDIEPA